MKITIEYEASWRNSFLEDIDGNNKPLPKTGRKFIGSIEGLKKKENFFQRRVTLDTIMGVLNRLIGDQRKLYQARADEHYFFRNIETCITYKDKPTVINSEMTYVRNISGNFDKTACSGMIKINDPLLSSDYSKELWGVLSLSLPELYEFIMDESFKVSKEISLDPRIMADEIDLLEKVKKVENIGLTSEVVQKINHQFPELKTEKMLSPYIEKDGKIIPMRIYAAALYIQFERLTKYFDMSSAISKRGALHGFSKRGYNKRRDFMKRFTTGGPKKVWGNPYIHEEFVKGVGKTKHLMTKASGTLEINIDVERTKAKEIRDMIENAGVSSFYLGKKGLAYVSKIRV